MKEAEPQRLASVFASGLAHPTLFFPNPSPDGVYPKQPSDRFLQKTLSFASLPLSKLNFQHMPSSLEPLMRFRIRAVFSVSSACI